MSKNSVTIKQLIASIGRPINENNKRYVRQVIHNLFMKYDKQIGSFRYNNGGGYFIIRTEEKIEQKHCIHLTVNSLLSLVDTINEKNEIKRLE